MSKKKTTRQEFKPTKKTLSNLQKQKRKQKIVLFSGVATVTVALVFLVLGLVFQWYIPRVKPLGEVVIEVNETKIKMDYYIDAFRYQAQGQSTEILPYFFEPVTNYIVSAELLKQNAADLGYQITDAQVNDYLKDYDIKPNDAIKDYVRGFLLREELVENYFKPMLPESGEHRQVNAMFLESESQLQQMLARIENDETFSDLAAEYSLDSNTKNNKGDLGFKPEGVFAYEINNDILTEAVFSASPGTGSVYQENKSKNVGYWLIEIVDRRTEGDIDEAHVKIMLLGSEAEALQIRELLEGGGDFEDLAKEFCHIWEEETGSDLGWIVPGDVSDTFDAFVFGDSASAGSISEPIRDTGYSTSGGWWLFKILDIKETEISNSHADTLAEIELSAWMQEVESNPDNVIVKNMDDDKKSFVLSRLR